MFSFKHWNHNFLLQNYIKKIDDYNAKQTNFKMLDAIRKYNHFIIDNLNSIKPLSGLRLLDVGASPHGYALEKSLDLGVTEYIGIGLDIHENVSIKTPIGSGSLLYMNAESLSFKDNEFDAILSISTFEHIADLRKVLSEFHRVLKPQGCALITFEPVWTCSYGHHLHHLGEISKLVPDWAHLLLSPTEMKNYLSQCWPKNEKMSISEICNLIYEDNFINRIGIKEMRKIISESPMHIEWIVPIPDEPRDEKQLISAAEKTGLSKEELMIKGLSMLLYKK